VRGFDFNKEQFVVTNKQYRSKLFGVMADHDEITNLPVFLFLVKNKIKLLTFVLAVNIVMRISAWNHFEEPTSYEN
jgi:hypothetical protein